MWWQSLSEVLGPVVSLGLEVNDHKRTNHLHREGIAQALRIHESETNANKEYHRVEMRQQNDQHARGLLQSKVQHEENVDLEKRIAIRENLRDEWEQLTAKAETMLIVNTLMLGVCFAFLIEGTFPDEVTILVPMAPVCYLSVLAFAICSLLLSVRFAMVLRFRVGQTIVKEMRLSMRRTFQVDSKFRNCEHYHKCNRARVVAPACDDTANPERVRRLQPLTRQMTRGTTRKKSSIFHAKPHETCEDLSWLNDESGYRYLSWLKMPDLRTIFGCRRRLRPRAGGTDPFVSPVPDAYGDTPWNNGESGGLGRSERLRRTNTSYNIQNERENASPMSFAHPLERGSRSTRELAEFPPSVGIRNGRRTRPAVREDDGEGDLRAIDSTNSAAVISDVSIAFSEPEGERECASDREEPQEEHDDNRPSPIIEHAHDFRATEAEFDQIAQTYQGLLALREIQDQFLNGKLERLRQGWCKPYDIYSQRCYWIGTVALFVSAMTLTFGRWMVPRQGLKNGPIPGSTLAAASFTAMCSGTILILGYMERKMALGNMPNKLTPIHEEIEEDADFHDMLHDLEAQRKGAGIPAESPKEDSHRDHTPNIFTPIVFLYLFLCAVCFITAQGVLSYFDFYVIGNMGVVDLFWKAQGASYHKNHLLVVGGYMQLNVIVDEAEKLPFSSSQLSFPVMDVCAGARGYFYLTHIETTGDVVLKSDNITHVIPGAQRLGCGEGVWVAFADSFKRIVDTTDDPLRYDALIRSPAEGMTLTAFDSTKEGLYALYDGVWLIRLRDNYRRYIAPQGSHRWVAMAATPDGILLISDGHDPIVGKQPF
eukprot:GEMP01012675.1.p1 GENE.GEMP01012675.1~~GEMP01012675.1.p1  ORF type:complete len:823 (+),score=176.34 GEMP01012675.1:86-2554(+)